ncbi:MAG TPA: hypothetical protein DCQ30_12060 [Acidimicrobiaceae bacterium]|nr:hypothetical protein [Acidimicrobiaceae bacterium]
MTRRRQEPQFGIQLDELGDASGASMGVRFCFGAAISLVAGVVSLALGERAGGLLLAFPAILPSTLTLIEKEESERAAEDDDVGAVLGATGLVAFALAGWLLLSRLPAALAILAAAVCWSTVAVGLYVAFRAERG